MSLRYTSDVEIPELDEAPDTLSGREAVLVVQNRKTYKTTVSKLVADLNMATHPVRPEYTLIQNLPDFSGSTVGELGILNGTTMFTRPGMDPVATDVVGVTMPAGQIQHFVDLTVEAGITGDLVLPSGNYSGAQACVRASFPKEAGGYVTLTTTPDGWHYNTEVTCTQAIVLYHNSVTLQIWAASNGCWYEEPVSGNWTEGLPPGYPSGWNPFDPTLSDEALINVRSGSVTAPVIDTLESDPTTASVDSLFFMNNGTEWKSFPAPADVLILE